MAGEPVETTEKERAPRYKKTVNLFALALIAVLVVVLALDAVTRSRKSRNQEGPQEPNIAFNREGEGAEADFKRRFDAELKRRRQAQAAAEVTPLESEQETLERLKAQRDGKTVSHAEGQGESVEAQFKKSERRRALEARKSRLKLNLYGLKPNGAKREPALATTVSQKETDEPTINGASVSDEISRVEAQLAGMGLGHAQAAQVPPPERQEKDGSQVIFRPQSAPGVAVVGRPAQEKPPEPGQKLLPTGAIIGAVLDQMLISDYVGSFRGLITHDVYDISGRFILIPKGSRVVGKTLKIANVNEPIQARMGLTGNWIVLPNGKRISLEKTVLLDQAGVPALKDRVNYHLLAQFLGVAAYAVLSSETSRSGSGYNEDSTFEGDLGASFRRQFAPLAAKYLSLVPTITLREGTPMKLFIENDLFIHPWSRTYEKFHQKAF